MLEYGTPICALLAPPGAPPLFEDRETPGNWRVEWFDDDGGCEVEIFTDPDARGRAIR